MEKIHEKSGFEEVKEFIEKYVLCLSTKTYSTQEAADWIGVTKKTLYKYMKAGKITFFQDDAVIRFEREDVQNFLSKNKRNAA